MSERNDFSRNEDIGTQREERSGRGNRRSPILDYSKLTGFHRAVPVLLFALAIFVTICFLTKNTGVVGQAISTLFLGLFAGGAFVIPVLLVLHAIFYASDLEQGRLLTRVIFSVVTLISVSAVLYAIRNFGEEPAFAIADYFREGRELVGGGFIGSVIGFALMWMFDSVGVIVIALMIVALYITFFFSRERGVFSYLGLKALAAIVGLFSLIERGVKKMLSKIKNARQSRRDAEVVESRRELYDDDFFAVDNGLEELKIEELGILETRSREEIEKNPTLHDKVRRDSESAPKSEARAWQTPDEKPNMTENERRTVDMARDLYFTEVKADEDAPIEIEAQEVPESVPHKSHNDLSAGEVFTEGFDPFDFERNLALSKKASSGLKAVPSEKTPLYAQSIASIDEEDIAKAKRREAFERRKAELMGKMAPESTLRPEPKKSATPTEQRVGETFEFAEGHGILHTPKEEVKHEIETFSFDGPSRSEPLPFERAYRESAAQKTLSFTEKSPEMRGGESPYSFSTTLQKRPEERVSVRPEALSHEAKESESRVFSFDSKEKAEKADDVAKDEVTPIVRAFETGRTEVQTPTRESTKPFADAVAQATVTPSEPAPTLRVEREILTPPVPEEVEEAEEVVYDEVAEDAFEDEVEEASDYDEEEVIEELSEQECEEELIDMTPIPPDEQNPAVREMRSQFTFLRNEDKEAEAVECEETEEEEVSGFAETVDSFADSEEADEYEDEDDVPFEETPRETSSRFNDYLNSLKKQEEERREAKAAEVKAPKEPKPAADYSNYKYPPVDLLSLPEIDPGDNSQAEINENGEKLIDTLDSFRVTASIKGVDRGPRITRYEVVPARGVKVSAITNLFDDISLALAADGVRMEAPIPGKSAIGFEIPNKKPATVYLRDLIESSEFRTNPSKTFVCIGKDVTGNPVFGDIAKMPHVLVAGATGMGKSVCINSIMMSLLFRARPDEVKFIMIDPKKVEFSGYNGIPHLLVPVVIDPKQAAGALMWAVEEMEKRFDLIEQAHVKKIDDYNAKVRENPELGTPMAKIVIVIDELNDLMVQVRDPVENLIMRIAQKARAAGIHLIIGTQRPSVNVITGVIKANIPSRISCKVSSNVDSRTILEQAGAEKLLDKGDMLFWPVGKPKAIRVQGAFVSDNEVESIMDFIRKQSKGDEYDADILEQINRAASKCSKSKDEDDEDGEEREESGEGYLNDQKFLDAVNVALNCGKISTSLLQRKVGLGFGRAARYIDIMEDLGVVGERNGQKPRDVLITKQEWNEMLSRRSLD